MDTLLLLSSSLLGAFIYILYTWKIHYKSKFNSSLSFGENIGYVFTLDYFFAKKYKPNDRIKKSNYIKLMNKSNITLTLIIFDIFIILNYFNVLIIFDILMFLIGFIGYRCISRSLELIISFGNDVITPKKSSILTAEDRVKLAINSYIEVILNYSIFYYLLSIVGIYKTEPINFFTSFFKSIGISTFSGIGTSHLGIFSSFHLFTSFVLVVFAIASYLSNIGEEQKDREVSKALLKNQKERNIDKYLKSNEYKLLDKKNLILDDLKAYKENLLINFETYINK